MLTYCRAFYIILLPDNKLKEENMTPRTGRPKKTIKKYKS